MHIHTCIQECICQVSTLQLNTTIKKSDLSKSHGISVRLQKWCMIPISHTKGIFYFSATKFAFGVNPRDDDHRGMQLATDGERMTIASRISLHKHAYYSSGRGRHMRYWERSVAPP